MTTALLITVGANTVLALLAQHGGMALMRVEVMEIITSGRSSKSNDSCAALAALLVTHGFDVLRNHQNAPAMKQLKLLPTAWFAPDRRRTLVHIIGHPPRAAEEHNRPNPQKGRLLRGHQQSKECGQSDQGDQANDVVGPHWTYVSPSLLGKISEEASCSALP